MKIKEISIKHFRGIKDLKIKLNNFTVLIGKNGVGKSSILHALNFFKEPKYSLRIEDYYNKDSSRSIEVSLTFTDLSSQEQSEFNPYIQNDELKVIKIATSDDDLLNPNVSQSYHGQKLLHEPFNVIRELDKATPKRAVYDNMRQQDKYSSLERVTRADDIEAKLIEWEKNHTNELKLQRDTKQLFGWAGVGAGKLNKSVRFFFIPAVHEYSEEEKAKKSTYLNEILDLTIRNRIIETQDLTEFKENTINRYKELIKIENADLVKDLSVELSNRLNELSPGCNLFIDFKPGNVNFTETEYGTELQEYGFRGPISTLGHGVQRTSFFTLLRFLGEQHVARQIRDVESEENEDDEETFENKFFILFIIEEPELYQHPNRIRSIKKILEDLTIESNDSRFQFQIICSSHSPYLIDIQNAENIRIVKKIKINDHYDVEIKEVHLDKIAQKLKDFGQSSEDRRYDDITLKSRLKAIMTLELSEGFFADKIVLVEGLEDKAVIQAIDLSLNEETFDNKGIVVIPVLGKNNLDRPALIFMELDIPVYMIFDTDSDCSQRDIESNKKTNTTLRRIMGEEDIEDPFAEKVEKTYASLDPKMTKILKNTIGEEHYRQIMDELKEKYQFNKDKDCRKNAIIMKEFLEKSYERNLRIHILEMIIQKIYEL